jgi:NTE family protein
MNDRLAFVLGGGGARGALQVGALQALLEAGLQPDILVGTSIGAVNAAFLALHGVNLEGVRQMVSAWDDASTANLLPSNYLWLTVRALFNRPGEQTLNRMQDFFISHGLTPGLRFGDIQSVRLIIVAADLNEGNTVLYGLHPEDSILEALLATTALPPWVKPLQMRDRLLMDGGVVSNLPIEPALRVDAKEIIAMSLNDSRDITADSDGFGSFISRLFNIVEQRQLTLEFALAEAKGVKIHRLDLLAEEHVPIWQFENFHDLIDRGYEITQRELAEGTLHSLISKGNWFDQLKKRIKLLGRRKQ